MSPDDKRHGTNAGYLAHRRDGESACLPCHAARARYDKRRKYDKQRGRSRTIPVLGSRRRIQALVALGWTYGRIGERTGLTARYIHKVAAINPSIWRTTAERIAEAYEEMSMTLPPTATRYQKRDASYAKTVAHKHGWPPPLAWTNIDDPDEQPTDWHYTAVDPKNVYAARDVDPVVVMRLLEGVRVNANKAEKEEALRQWVADGGSQAELCRWHGWNESRYKGALRLVEEAS